MQLPTHGSILPENGKKATGVGKTDVLETWETADVVICELMHSMSVHVDCKTRGHNNSKSKALQSAKLDALVLV